MKGESNRTVSSSVRPTLEPPILWFWIVRLTVALLTVLGNGVVIYVITTRRRLQVKSNWFLLSLAVADFSVGAFVTPSGSLCSYWLWCDLRLQIVFYNSILYASTTSLWLLTFDRYAAVVWPLHYSSIMTEVRAKVFIALSWGFSVSVSAVRLTWIYSDPKGKLEKGFRLTMDLVYGFLSCVALSLAYIRILCLVQRHVQITARQRASVSFNQPNTSSASRREREKAWVRVLGLVVLLFVCCYSLSVYISFCLNFKLCAVSPEMMLTSLLLIHLNSALNFVVYALLKKDIRRELLRLCR